MFDEILRGLRIVHQHKMLPVLVELAHLAGGGLDDDIPERDLPVAAKGNVPTASDRKNGGTAILFHRIDVGMKNRITRPAGRRPDATESGPLSRAVLHCARNVFEVFPAVAVSNEAPQTLTLADAVTLTLQQHPELQIFNSQQRGDGRANTAGKCR